eukprot:8713936-Lingulodinium_polyedra.AAC.1
MARGPTRPRSSHEDVWHELWANAAGLTAVQPRPTRSHERGRQGVQDGTILPEEHAANEAADEAAGWGADTCQVATSQACHARAIDGRAWAVHARL